MPQFTLTSIHREYMNTNTIGTHGPWTLLGSGAQPYPLPPWGYGEIPLFDRSLEMLLALVLFAVLGTLGFGLGLCFPFLRQEICLCLCRSFQHCIISFQHCIG